MYDTYDTKEDLEEDIEDIKNPRMGITDWEDWEVELPGGERIEIHRYEHESDEDYLHDLKEVYPGQKGNETH